MNELDDVLDLFNCLVVGEGQRGGQLCYTHTHFGVITDFKPSAEQTIVLEQVFKPLLVTTLFTRAERETAPLKDLLVKQLLHYVEVYGLGAPGLFDLEVRSGEIVVMRLVSGISVEALAVLVKNLIYANAPVKDAEQVKRIIDKYMLAIDINRVANNELRILLFRPGMDVFTNGDDAVRYLCWLATGDTLLIKSPEVIQAIKEMKTRAPLSAFFTKHEVPLAQVFNRHKRLILAAKGSRTASTINHIARLSKTRHVPIRENIAKTFIHKALTGEITVYVPDGISVRDKLKYLNVLAQRHVQSEMASFNIRNGKVYTRAGRAVYAHSLITRVERMVLASLESDLRHLKGQTILLDKNVDYGLPVSRKQTIGNLPFGTQVTGDGAEISSGMYWEDDWGASDLDLSTIDMDGNRVGWGTMSGYNDNNIVYSGDLTSAHDGAMEFMTSQDAKPYGLFVNIYSGETGAGMELVVGSNPDRRDAGDAWITDVLVREKHTLKSRGSIIGFVKGKTFIVYAGRLSGRRVSGENPIINQSRVDFWTLQRLFSALDVKFDVDRDKGVAYNHDLSYSSFSFDKLEAVFENKTA